MPLFNPFDPSLYPLSSFAVPTADVSFNSKKLTNLAAPTVGADATNKTYVDAGDASTLATGEAYTDLGTGLSLSIAAAVNVEGWPR